MKDGPMIPWHGQGDGDDGPGVVSVPLFPKGAANHAASRDLTVHAHQRGTLATVDFLADDRASRPPCDDFTETPPPLGVGPLGNGAAWGKVGGFPG